MEENKEKIEVKDVIQVDNELLNNISDLVKEKSSATLLNLFADIHSADIAEIINHSNASNAQYLFSLLDTETASEVITEIDENLREKIINNFDTEKLYDIIVELETDDATDIVSELTDEVADEVLKMMADDEAKDVKELLKYNEDTAGGIMSSDFVAVQDTETIRAAIREVRNNAEDFEHIYSVYVLNHKKVLVGIVTLKSLLTNPLRTKITSVMQEDLIYVTPDVDQEEVAYLMKKYNLVAIPVVNAKKVMMGRITIDDIVDVIQEEADEDIQKMAGLSEEQESSDSIFRISRIRLPWLLMALVGELLGVFLLSNFGHIIEQITIAAFFFPILMAMGGSSGNQAAIVMVKGLSTGEVWLKDSLKKLTKELLVGIMNALVISGILYVATSLFFDDHRFLIILAISMITIIIFATMLGAIVPLVLKKLKLDPAVATGPFVSTSNDILGLIIYLTYITLFIIK
ncbi:MAG: magnesium transporter [Bacteroidetes bacterium]|nr:magnesium transporter [Bacteroidota bacterium]MBU1113556.1 magnesium transporter [Bacteroidota bacterium]MBU1800282.1 magnesium transporter [Bacteroidota bacterium]